MPWWPKAFTHAAELVATLERHGDAGPVVGVGGEIVRPYGGTPDAAVDDLR